ncbi:MAG: hypothetical protein LBM13_01315 [Candidatus Ancillula sp.]|jgi:predicted permease|nr:hypothetical protein [Candidatus Ancillula sp.]
MSILKIVIMPILTFFIVKFGLPLFGFKPSNLLVYAYVVSSTLPTAQNVFNFAVAYNKNIIPVRDTIFITTIIAPFLILGLAAIFGI